MIELIIRDPDMTEGRGLVSTTTSVGSKVLWSSMRSFTEGYDQNLMQLTVLRDAIVMYSSSSEYEYSIERKIDVEGFSTEVYDWLTGAETPTPEATRLMYEIKKNLKIHSIVIGMKV